MAKIFFSGGTLLNEFFILPTIRLQNKYIDFGFAELCWLKFYVGFKFVKNAED